MLIPIYYLQQSKHYLHSDIKPENYMILYPQLSNGEIDINQTPQLVLTDFGNCRTFSNESKYIRGTSKNWDSNRRLPLTVNHDIYPIGVCLYRMLTNKMPLGENEEQVQQKITESDSVKFPKWILKKDELQSFVSLARKILCFDEEKRVTFEELWKDEVVIDLLKWNFWNENLMKKIDEKFENEKFEKFEKFEMKNWKNLIAFLFLKIIQNVFYITFLFFFSQSKKEKKCVFSGNRTEKWFFWDVRFSNNRNFQTKYKEEVKN